MKQLVMNVVRKLKMENQSLCYFQSRATKSIEIMTILHEFGLSDEAVVALNLRKFASDHLVVDIDGKRFSWIEHDEIMRKLEEKDSRTIYLEKQGSEKLNELHIRESICGLLKNNIQEIHVDSKGLYAFIEFKSAEYANGFAKSFTWRPINSLTFSTLTGRNASKESNDKKRRVMLKSEWNTRMQEYYDYCRNHYTPQAPIHISTDTDTKQENKLEFQSGVIASFSGAHHDTTPKTIKKLIEMVAPVAFVDYNLGDTEGHVRFKNWRDALLAQSYFSRAFIVQQSGNDKCGMLLPHESRQHYRRWLRYQEKQPVKNCPFSLRVLEGRDEELYWKQIFEWQSYSKEKYQGDIMIAEEDQLDTVKEESVIMEGQPESAQALDAQKPKWKKKEKVKATHVVFKDSDEGDDIDNVSDKEIKIGTNLGSVPSASLSTKLEEKERIRTRKPRHRTSKRKLDADQTYSSSKKLKSV